MDNMTYEHFIRRGYKCDRYGRKGADADIFDSFGRVSFDHNQNPNDQKKAREFQKRLDEIKGYIDGALNHSLKRLGDNQHATNDVQALRQRANAASSIFDLSQIIEDGIAIFNANNIRMS